MRWRAPTSAPSTCKPAPLDLWQLACTRGARLRSERLQAAGLALELGAGAATSRHCLADPDRMRQVLDNLFENSLRYTAAGGRVVLHAHERRRRLLHLHLDDSAPGVPDEALERSWRERFYRVDASRSRAHGGAGLGLALCRRLLEAQGAQLPSRIRRWRVARDHRRCRWRRPRMSTAHLHRRGRAGTGRAGGRLRARRRLHGRRVRRRRAGAGGDPARSARAGRARPDAARPRRPVPVPRAARRIRAAGRDGDGARRGNRPPAGPGSWAPTTTCASPSARAN
jgi:hypothetical protein